MARERTNYGRAYFRYRSPERKAQDAFYDNIKRFAGEILTIERFVIKTTALSMRTATVRYDDNTVFELNLYHHDLVKLTDAGYELPTTIGEHDFHAQVIFKWQEVLRDNRLVIDTVLPKTEAKEQPMKTVQPESNEPDYAAIDLGKILDDYDLGGMEEPFTPDISDILLQLTALRDELANSPTILGLSGDALTVATAKANAAHYIDNAISSLEMALPVPLISGNDVTEKIPVAAIMANTDTETKGEAA